MGTTLRDLTGKTFTNWRVIKRAENGGVNGTVTMWRCRCKCKTVRDVATTSLQTGTSKSCGCLPKQLPGRVIDLTGQRFGKLRVIERASQREGSAYAWWKVRCDCKKIYDLSGGALRAGQISCGCGPNRRNRRHGHAAHGNRKPAWRSWQSMMQRCFWKGSDKWSRYGGRGITVCKRWRTYENFYADMGDRPLGKTLDRKHVNRNYCPSNCRWADRRTQAMNRETPAKLRKHVRRLERKIARLEVRLARREASRNNRQT